MAALLPDGRRAWGTSTDPDLLATLTTEETAGRAGHVASDGGFELT